MRLNYCSPPTCWQLRPEQVHVYLVPLKASPVCIEDFLLSLKPEECELANRFQTSALRDEFIAARGTLRTILGHCLNVSPSKVPLEYGEYGKPQVAASHALRFNLSHSGGLALYALSLTREIGVDIEQIVPVDDYEQIARQFFSPREISDMLSVPSSHRAEAFFTCWTRKEAYIKATGQGLNLALDCFRVSLLPAEPPLLEAPLDTRVWSIFDTSPKQGFAAAVVAEGIAPPPHTWFFSDADDCVSYFSNMGGTTTRKN